VEFAVAPPLILPPVSRTSPSTGIGGKALRCSFERFGREDVEADAFDARRRIGEVFVR